MQSIPHPLHPSPQGQEAGQYPGLAWTQVEDLVVPPGEGNESGPRQGTETSSREGNEGQAHV